MATGCAREEGSDDGEANAEEEVSACEVASGHGKRGMSDEVEESGHAKVAKIVDDSEEGSVDERKEEESEAVEECDVERRKVVGQESDHDRKKKQEESVHERDGW